MLSIQIETQAKEVLAFAVDENAEFAVTGHINGVGYVSTNYIENMSKRTGLGLCHFDVDFY